MSKNILTKRRIMMQLMVELTIPTPFTPEFMLQIPEQRKVIDEFMEDGVVLSYALSMDRAKLWMVLAVDEYTEVAEIMMDMPLFKDLEYQVTELMFNHAGTVHIPAFSLN